MPLKDEVRENLIHLGKSRKTKWGLVVLFLVFVSSAYLWWGLSPASAQGGENVEFEIQPGDGFIKIAGGLRAAHLLKSQTAFETLSLITGSFSRFKPGLYRLAPTMSAAEIVYKLVSGVNREVQVTVPEGSSVYEVDDILSDTLVIKRGELIAYDAEHHVEGKLFPDTYRFFIGSNIEDVVARFSGNFNAQVAPLLQGGQNKFEDNLIVASLVEKEVPGYRDREMVAGILWKRLKNDLPLQVDSTICYIKKKPPISARACYPLTPLDFKLDSPYNTYLHGGLPPGPISSPGLEAVRAVLNPVSSPYWFYLSDPKTQKTIFAVTLGEQNQNKAIHLK